MGGAPPDVRVVRSRGATLGAAAVLVGSLAAGVASAWFGYWLLVVPAALLAGAAAWDLPAAVCTDGPTLVVRRAVGSRRIPAEAIADFRLDEVRSGRRRADPRRPRPSGSLARALARRVPELAADRQRRDRERLGRPVVVAELVSGDSVGLAPTSPIFLTSTGAWARARASCEALEAWRAGWGAARR